MKKWIVATIHETNPSIFDNEIVYKYILVIKSKNIFDQK